MAGVTKKYLARGAVAVVFAATAIIGCQQSLLIRDEIAQKIANANTKYTFTVTAGAGGTVSPGGSNTAGLGVPFPIAATPNTGGYLFSSWTASPAASASFGDPNSSSTSVTLTGDNVTIQASFIPPATRNWSSVASDSTGMHLAAVVYGGQIYTSSNYGSTWTLQRASQSTTWTSIASDSTGQYLVASVYSGSIYTSTNYGATWTARTSGVPASAQFQSVTSDGSGKYLATVVSGGTIYVSTNYGASWTAGTGLPATGSWYSVSSDYSGQYLIACTGLTTGNVYTSTNYGSSWSLTTVASGGLGLGSPAFFDTVAIGRTVTSANPYYYAAVSGEDIYSYHNNGHTIWGDYHVAKYWNSMAADATGQYLIVSSDSVYTSSNYGSTFATGTGLPSSVSWSSVASDSSGTYLAAGVYGGHIYVSQNQGANWSLGL